jgi:hypothetical protein
VDNWLTDIDEFDKEVVVALFMPVAFRFSMMISSPEA